ncbi:MAG: hypothetical protein AB7O29_13655, partial [Acidimicrobiia bacterium]
PADATTSIVADPAVPADHVSSTELEAVLADEASRAREVLAGLDPLALVDALVKVGRRSDLAAGGLALAVEALRIALGRSTVVPAERDWRFRHEAWRENPLFRRLGQGYLAWASTVEGLVEDADLDWRTAERARFAAGLLTSTLAPTNLLVTNPAAIERAFRTGGRSLLRGLRNMARVVVDNGGLPRSVDLRPFRVGETIAATPGAVVHRDEVFELIQYTPTTSRVHVRPLVVVPPQINKYYFLDLAPGRSFVEYAVAQGHQTFCISWRNPTAEHQGWDFDTYVAAVERALVAAAEITKADRVNTVSMCAGGIATAALLAHHAATGTELVGSAAFGVTLLDFDLPSGIAMLASRGIVDHSLRTTREAGVLDGRCLFAFFSALRPNDLVWNYWVNNNLLGDDPPGVRRAGLEPGRHPAPGRAACRLPRPVHDQPPGRAGGDGGAGNAGRPRSGRVRHVRGRCPDRPPHAVEGVLRQHPAPRWRQRVRALVVRPHPEPREPAREPEDALLPGPEAARLARRLVGRGHRPHRLVVGAVGGVGGRAGRPAGGPRPAGWATGPTAPTVRHPAPMCWPADRRRGPSRQAAWRTKQGA